MSNVATRTSAVDRMEAERKLPRALMGGTKAMREAGEEYLPREEAESAAAYTKRLKRSFLFNGFAKTVRDMAGKVFTKPIDISEDMPQELVKFAENIDLSGRNLDVFAHAVFTDAMSEGISYILVEMDKPQLDENGNPRRISLAESKKMNRRPWAVHIKARQVLGWRSATINGTDVLTQFRFIENVTEDDGEFGEKEVEQVRVFKRNALAPEGAQITWEVWRRKENGDSKTEWVIHENGSLTINEIPVCPVYVARTGFMQGKPPLLDLAEINQEHWQSKSDQRNILHVARVPILFGRGWSAAKEQVAIGASQMITVSSKDADLKFVEHSGHAIKSGNDDLKDLEFQMQTMGLELLIPKPGGQTATGAAIDQAKMHAPLAMMANALKDALEQMFGFMGLYGGLDADVEGGSLTVNTDFGVSMRDARDLEVLLNAVKEKAISRETFIREVRRRGVITDDIDEQEELDRILDEGFEDAEGDDAGGGDPALGGGKTKDPTFSNQNDV